MGETLFQIITQSIGFVAMACGVFSFQVKPKSRLLLIQSVGSLLWATQFFLLDSPMGALMNIVVVARNLLYIAQEKYPRLRSRAVPIVTVAVIVGLTVPTVLSEGAAALLPGFASVVQTLAYLSTDENRIRRLAFFVSPPWLIYNVISGSIAGAVCECFNLTSIAISLIRFRKSKEKTEDCK